MTYSVTVKISAAAPAESCTCGCTDMDKIKHKFCEKADVLRGINIWTKLILYVGIFRYHQYYRRNASVIDKPKLGAILSVNWKIRDPKRENNIGLDKVYVH